MDVPGIGTRELGRMETHLVPLPSDAGHFKIFPCDANVFVLDACSLVRVIGGGEVFAKVETLFSLCVARSSLLEVLEEGDQNEGSMIGLGLSCPRSQGSKGRVAPA
jgi:hypothetical protein